MAALDDLAKIKKPTAKQILEVYQDNGLPLTVSDGRLVAPKGTPPGEVESLTKHEAELIRLLTDGSPKVSNRHRASESGD